MLRLFFLEDDGQIFRKMKELLEKCANGQRVICEQCVSFAEAQQKIQQEERYDGFILNIRVEGSSYTGRYLAALIREQSRYATTPIVFVSNFPLMQTWLEETLGLCWFIKKTELEENFPKLMAQILGFRLKYEETKTISELRLLVKKKESIEVWVMVKDLIALRSMQRDQICLYTVTEGKRLIRGSRGMMALIEEQIYQQNINCLQFINHSEIINLNFFRTLEKRDKEGVAYGISMFGCDELFIPSRQYLHTLRGLLGDA